MYQNNRLGMSWKEAYTLNLANKPRLNTMAALLAEGQLTVRA
jgi:hypothetical protein